MRAPATSGARVDHGQARKPAAKRSAAQRPAAQRPAAKKSSARKSSAPKSRSRRSAEPEIKITRNSKRPQIKASRGPGGSSAKRKAPERRTIDRAAETRRQSLNSLNAGYASSVRSRSRSGSPRGGSGGGGGGVRAVAVGAGGAAAGAVRVASEVARPAAAAARPMLRVISGGIDKIPTGATDQPFARGRALILLAAVLGAGLIYINVAKLQGGDAYGKFAAQSAVLQRENTALRAKVSYLASAERIQAYATRFGMISPLPEQFKYMHTKRGDALKGVKNYTAPTNAGVSPTAAPQQDQQQAQQQTQQQQTQQPQQQASTTDPANQPPVSGTGTTTTQTTPDTAAPAGQ